MKGRCPYCGYTKELVKNNWNQDMCRGCLEGAKRVQDNNEPAGVG